MQTQLQDVGPVPNHPPQAIARQHAPCGAEQQAIMSAALRSRLPTIHALYAVTMVTLGFAERGAVAV